MQVLSKCKCNPQVSISFNGLRNLTAINLRSFVSISFISGLLNLEVSKAAWRHCALFCCFNLCGRISVRFLINHNIALCKLQIQVILKEKTKNMITKNKLKIVFVFLYKCTRICQKVTGHSCYSSRKQ